jgi:hypothetical protein
LLTRKKNGVTVKDGASLNNKILPYSTTTVAHDTIETSLKHVEDGLGIMHSTKDDLKLTYEDHSPPNTYGLHPKRVQKCISERFYIL